VTFAPLSTTNAAASGKARLARTVWKLVQSPTVIFVIALAIRLWAVSQLVPVKPWKYFYRYNEFARIAWAIASGYGYSSPWADKPLTPTAIEPPVYSYLLAGIFKFTGAYTSRSLWIAVVLNAVLSAITAVLVLRIGRRDFSPAVGVLASWVWSCWLYEAVVSIRLWESSLAALLLMAALLWLPRLASSPGLSAWLQFGALAGVASLTNTTLLAVFPFFWLWSWVDSRRRGQGCGKRALVSLATFVLVLMPWTIRNYAVFHRLMPVRDNFGLELWLGNGEQMNRPSESDFPLLNPAEYNRVGEIRFMDEKREMALVFIRQHPAEFFRSCADRIFHYWTDPEVAVWLPLSILAWSGMILALRRKGSEAVPYAIVLLAFPLIYYITHTFPTYRHPTEPVILLLASYTVIWAGKRLLPIRELDPRLQTSMM
jgi:hypothetical protein